MVVFRADRHRHGIPLEAHPVDDRVGLVVALWVAVGLLPEIEQGTTGKDCQVQDPVERELLRLQGS